ncbi:LPXTG cell wall anchor domain-containing protein [Lacticaseibacillus baoqingensis]|uniref:LPXTG cell wall anchor domain-containing protein n=1 Tax=Lacticaseibacillus baoqingensis TaxID=2486013 RepID=A0ABW4E9F2_9LACO|nr:LPXTG cell wall anchor domain-containing protein [Lacticaseibacillus baoqingensis]
MHYEKILLGFGLLGALWFGAQPTPVAASEAGGTTIAEFNVSGSHTATTSHPALPNKYQPIDQLPGTAIVSHQPALPLTSEHTTWWWPLAGLSLVIGSAWLMPKAQRH